MIGKYYIANAVSSQIWLIVSLLKTFDNIAYHRTIDGTNNTMEFLVPESTHDDFIIFIEHCKKSGYITDYYQSDNVYDPNYLQESQNVNETHQH